MTTVFIPRPQSPLPVPRLSPSSPRLPSHSPSPLYPPPSQSITPTPARPHPPPAPQLAPLHPHTSIQPYHPSIIKPVDTAGQLPSARFAVNHSTSSSLAYLNSFSSPQSLQSVISSALTLALNPDPYQPHSNWPVLSFVNPAFPSLSTSPPPVNQLTPPSQITPFNPLDRNKKYHQSFTMSSEWPPTLVESHLGSFTMLPCNRPFKS